VGERRALTPTLSGRPFPARRGDRGGEGLPPPLPPPCQQRGACDILHERGHTPPEGRLPRFRGRPNDPAHRGFGVTARGSEGRFWRNPIAAGLLPGIAGSRCGDRLGVVILSLSYLLGRLMGNPDRRTVKGRRSSRRSDARPLPQADFGRLLPGGHRLQSSSTSSGLPLSLGAGDEGRALAALLGGSWSSSI